MQNFQNLLHFLPQPADSEVKLLTTTLLWLCLCRAIGTTTERERTTITKKEKKGRGREGGREAEWESLIILQVPQETNPATVVIPMAKPLPAWLCTPFIYPLTVRVTGAPQMTSQPVSSIFLYFPLPSRTWWTSGCPFHDVVFPPLLLSALSSSPFHCALQDGFGQTFSLCLARWFWPDLMNGGHVHTTAVCVSLR